MKAAPIASASSRPTQIMLPFAGRDILTPGTTIYKGDEQARAVKAVIYYSYDDIRVEQRPIPTITDHELLVQVHGCGLCGSDILKIVQRARPPVVLGHELTGTIVKRGKAIPTTVGTQL